MVGVWSGETPGYGPLSGGKLLTMTHLYLPRDGDLSGEFTQYVVFVNIAISINGIIPDDKNISI